MMDAATLKLLSDDDLREMLEENGYNPPPITDDVVRGILRRKLFKMLNPNEEYPDTEVSDAEDEVEIRDRKHFGVVNKPSTINSQSVDANMKTASESSFPTFVVVCFILMNITLAVFILYRDWLF